LSEVSVSYEVSKVVSVRKDEEKGLFVMPMMLFLQRGLLQVDSVVEGGNRTPGMSGDLLKNRKQWKRTPSLMLKRGMRRSVCEGKKRQVGRKRQD
jgi:hypothetical protein